MNGDDRISMEETMKSIEQKIREDWPGTDPGPLLIVHSIIGRMKSGEGPSQITIPMVTQVLENHNVGADIKSAYEIMSYLASERVGLLDDHYRLHRSDGSCSNLDGVSIAEGLDKGKLYDPVSGDLIEEWEKCVEVFFSPTPMLKSMADNYV